MVSEASRASLSVESGANRKEEEEGCEGGGSTKGDYFLPFGAFSSRQHLKRAR